MVDNAQPAAMVNGDHDVVTEGFHDESQTVNNFLAYLSVRQQQYTRDCAVYNSVSILLISPRRQVASCD
jgi:hypothetical protein